MSYRDSPGFKWTEEIKALKAGDECEWRFAARKEWQAGTVVRNGGSGYWHVEGPDGEVHKALYAEQVKAKGGSHYEDKEAS